MLAIASIPALKAPKFFEAVPVYSEGVAEDPRAFVAEGRIGEPVAADPGPEPKPLDEPTRPVVPAFPVALTYPVGATTLVELNISLNEALHGRKFRSYLIIDG